MDDEQCDLDALSAMLEEDSPCEKLAQNAPSNEEELCFSDSEDDADLDVLASLVENDTQDNESRKETSPPKATTQHQAELGCHDDSPKVNQQNGNMDAANLQEELRQMQEKMLMLQQQLAQQQQQQTVQQQNLPQPSQPKSRETTQKLLSASLEQNSNSRKEVSANKQPEFRKTVKQNNAGDRDDVNPFFPDDQTSTPNNNNKHCERKLSGSNKSTSDADNKAAFFPDSDSDWEDMDGEKEAGLSKEGKTLKKLLTGGQKRREAHTPTPSLSSSNTPETKLRRKSTFDQESTKDRSFSSSSNSHTPKLKEKEDVMFFAGIRIINPKVSSELLKVKMDGRKQMKISRLGQKLNPADLEGNWVTFGVLVHKSETRKSSNGNTYCIWKLSDLDDEDNTMTFFLFRDVYKHHWKCQTGAVLGLLNPNLMQKAEKFQSENSFTVDHPGQILIVGQSKDLGTCKGTTKAGKVCNNFINKRLGEYCKYHVQAVYKKASAKRGDLQSGFSGAAPKAYNKKIIPSGSHVFYGGQTFSTLPSCAKSVSKNNVSLKQLQTHNSTAKGKVTTLSLHELEELKSSKEAGGKAAGGKGVEDKPFLEFLSTPTVGSLNLVKHLIKKESSEEAKTKSKVLLESITPAELLKQHRQQMAEIKQRQKAKSLAPGVAAGPQLGKGLKPGQDIFFGGPSKSPRLSGSPRITKPRNFEVAKKQAIAKVLSKGGVSKQDPNAVRKTLTSPENVQRINKRVADNLKSDEETSPSANPPPAKRSRYLGNVDLNSEEVKKLLKAKSSHSGALSEIQAERREKYFGELEKKEQYEEKMCSVTEIKCTAYTCYQCKYTALSSSDLCKSEGHKVIQIKAAKRFYKCTSCKTRTLTLHRYPTVSCRSCHSKSFERTSMWKEKEGPKLESEILMVTGDSAKYLDSQIR